MAKYRFLRSVKDVKHGSFSDGQEEELTPEQAKALRPFIVLLTKQIQIGEAPVIEPPVIETAAIEPQAEKAVVRAPRRRKTKPKE